MNTNEPNPFLRRLDQIQDARTKWESSEWLLSFLRSESNEQPKIPTDEEILQWAQNLH